MPIQAPETVSPSLALLLAVTGLLATVVVPIVLALINRGGKAQPVVADQSLFVPRAEYDRLLGVTEDQDDELHAAASESARLRAEVDLWRDRAYEAGWRSS